MVHKPLEHKYETETIILDRVPLDTARALVRNIATIVKSTKTSYMITKDSIKNETIEVKIKECVPFDLENDVLGG